MPWTYSQSTGQLRHNGTLISTGYSGRGPGRNAPAQEHLPNTGPIPRGQYSIGALQNSTGTGPNVMPLTPTGHNARGRTAFQIHGNNAANDASSGCIIMPPGVRLQIGNSPDKVLIVNE